MFACSAETKISLIFKHDDTFGISGFIRAKYFNAIVGTAIVNANYFIVIKRLIEKAIKTTLEIVLYVINRNND